MRRRRYSHLPIIYRLLRRYRGDIGYLPESELKRIKRRANLITKPQYDKLDLSERGTE